MSKTYSEYVNSQIRSVIFVNCNSDPIPHSLFSRCKELQFCISVICICFGFRTSNFVLQPPAPREFEFQITCSVATWRPQ
jgi:hypothetical protein